MRYTLKTIKNKITLLASLCLLLVATLLVSLSLHEANKNNEQVKQSTSGMLTDNAERHMQSLGKIQALQLQKFFTQKHEYAMGVSRHLLYLRQRLKSGDLSPQTLRNELTDQLRQALIEKPDLLGLYVIFETNALDGADTSFVNRPDLGSNETGRFTMYWLQTKPGTLQPVIGDEGLLANTQPGPSGNPYNSFYTCARDTRMACVLDPYFDDASGTRKLVTSIALPLLENEKVIAVVGLDISLDSMQIGSESSSKKLFNGNGEISIISPRGLLAAHSVDASYLGQKLGNLFPSNSKSILEAIQLNQTRTLIDQKNIAVLEPLEPMKGTAPWGVLVSSPKKVLLEPLQRLQNELDYNREQAAMLELLLGFGAALLGVILIWFAALRITRPLQSLTHMLDDIAEGDGDLTRRLALKSNDEIGQLAKAFNRFVERIHNSIREVSSTTQKVNEVAIRVVQNTHLSMVNSDEQANRTNSVAAAINELGAASQEIARNAANASTQATDARQLAEDGSQVVQRTMHAMSELSSKIFASSAHIEILNSKTVNIGQILEVIKSISQQTNLLALNAAIEAARAGDAGRGFAVVADEVRSLAYRTQESAQEIQKMIEELQIDARESVNTMTESQRYSDETLVITSKAGERLTSVTHRICKIDDMNQSVAVATEEQTSVIEALNIDITELNTLNQEGVENLNSTLNACNDLEQQAERLKQLVDSFRI